jgi:phosphotransferase system HPr (HPr) family protein
MAKILVVDDYRDTADSMAIWLKQLGHDVQIARDGYQAIELARRQPPDFVLLDIGLPRLNGYQVASALRQELTGPFVIIAITGYGQEEDRRQALAAGCDYHFLKPIDAEALITLLAALKRKESRIHDDPPSEAMIHEKRPVFTVRRQVEIVNALGFHLRAADKFVRLAQGFQANVTVTCDGRKVSGRSILDLATLAASYGSRLELEADGSDAEAAINALTGLIGRRFDEQE